MTTPNFTTEASLYATGECYRSAAVGAAERFNSVIAQQLCETFGTVVRRNRFVLLFGIAMHRAARRTGHLRA